jgi:hypothetical protein
MSSQLFICPTQFFEIYKTSDLSHLQNANCQRLLNIDRVIELASEIRQSLEAQRQPWLPQCLCVARYQEMDFLIDGQHRLAAYLHILQEMKEDLLVCVNTIEVYTKSDIHELFKIVNQSVPVAQLPEGISFADTNHVLSKYLQLHPMLFSECASRKPRKPRIHKQTFEEFIAQVKVLKPEVDFIELLEKFHQLCRTKTWRYFQRSHNESSGKIQTYLQKCQGFYLGMFPNSEWLSLVCNIQLGITFTRVKKRIPKALRIAVWNKCIGKSIRSCECPFFNCSNVIYVENFHCAHDIAEVAGGDLHIDNLYPCCSECNLNMGTMTFEQFQQVNEKRTTPIPL